MDAEIINKAGSRNIGIPTRHRILAFFALVHERLNMGMGEGWNSIYETFISLPVGMNKTEY